MSARLSLLTLAVVAWLGAASAQEPKFVAWPQKDALSPFRTPSDVYAPPDEVYRLLRIMQTLADAPNAPKSFGPDGREVLEDKRWQQARADVLRKGLDAGYLAQIIRLNRNAVDRATAFYGGFYVANIDHVFELIAHIPGEPERRTRELAMPRAIEFVRANLQRRFGDLPKDQQDQLVKALPAPGSPAAKAGGMTSAPGADDPLHTLPLVPFLQMLDLEEPIDQAQALWFLKETFTVRKDLAVRWLEPSLPRLAQLLRSPSDKVREQAIGLYAAIGPKDLPPAPTDEAALTAWATLATKTLFPPIRNLNDTIVQLHPSSERDALAQAAVAALETSAIGDPFRGQRQDGSHFAGFRVVTVPDELKPLAIPAGAVVTTVNGVAILDAASLLATVRQQIAQARTPRKLLVEYVLRGENRAVEYRLM